MTSVNADIAALREFHAALIRFRDAQRDAIGQADHRIAAARAALAGKVLRHRADADGAALATAEAPDRLDALVRWQWRTDEQAAVYAAAASRLRVILDEEVPRAAAHLQALIADLMAVRGSLA